MSFLVNSYALGWTPSELGSALALWLDAADAGTITLNGSNVSQWNDKSGNGRNATQGTAASQPAYTTNGLNSQPVLTFNSTSPIDFMEFSGSHTANWSIAAVARASSTSQAIIQFGNLNGNGSLFAEGSNWVARPSIYEGSTAPFVNSEVALLSGTYQATPTAATTLWKNGTQGSVYTIRAPIAATNLLSRIAWLGVYPLNGFIAEIVVANGVWSISERQRVEGYLAHKWGLVANLPSDHPYKTVAP